MRAIVDERGRPCRYRDRVQAAAIALPGVQVAILQ